MQLFGVGLVQFGMVDRDGLDILNVGVWMVGCRLAKGWWWRGGRGGKKWGVWG